MSKETILITGASRGLGAATARLAAQLGANVVLAARSEDDLRAVARQIEAKGGQARIAVGDVSRQEDCQWMVDKALQAFGRLDAVVNNAGVLGPIAPLGEADPEAWAGNLAINVNGPFMVTRAALPHLRRQRGRVMNVSSGAAINAMPGWGAYCVAKAALNHLTRILAEEEPEITAIAFRPGVVDTAMQATIREEGERGMTPEGYARFMRYYERGELLPPEAPGCALAVLALHAPHEWSGAFVAWDDEQVQSLVRRYACAPGR
jgi:NAD(P)-dependent dehydrogenase (short-subunit alcohol dehydrogenase family)